MKVNENVLHEHWETTLAKGFRLFKAFIYSALIKGPGINLSKQCKKENPISKEAEN